MSEVVNAVWIGRKLGPVHAACLRSFLKHGYGVLLHTFERPEDTPDGVEIFDAHQLMKPEEIVQHRASGSYALASDIYRYRIQREGMGLYVDADMYCLRPFPVSDCVLGWESDNYLGSAVLKFPQQSKFLAAVIESAENPHFIPPWMSSGRRRTLAARRLLGRPKHVSRMPWGTIGPHLITYWAKKLNALRQASPIDYFYPLHYEQTKLLMQPGLSVEDIASPRSYLMHLWSSQLGDVDPTPGTPLAEIIRT
ncbi:hypothetical protein ACHMW7_25520 [Aminobacter sp. UC22_36]|uniref:hypothetical protein n=1 Tax=Aminobacter sp. UC22_36 TaxID=3374549 RepID=UPI0037578D4F